MENRDNFDYTEWQREYFANQHLDDFLNKAKEYDQKNPFDMEVGTENGSE